MTRRAGKTATVTGAEIVIDASYEVR